MSKRSRFVACVAAAGLAFGLLFSPLHAQQANAPASPPAQPGQPAPRNAHEIMADLERAGEELKEAITAPDVLINADERAKSAPKAIPALKKMLGYARELAATPASPATGAEYMIHEFRVMLAIFGDAEALAELRELTKSEKADEALGAKVSLATIQWLQDPTPEAQTRILDELEVLATQHPDSDGLAMTLAQLSQQGAADPQLAQRAETIMSGMTSPAAEQFKAQLANERKLKEMEGQPIVFDGVTIDGEPLSTEQWKGKVVLVDFWATWCAPCIAEMPELKEIYDRHHEQGLEMVGISSDFEPAMLKRYLRQNVLPWPTLFDESNPGPHAMAQKYDVQMYPTKFLIDRKGVLHAVNPEDLEASIEQLLADPAS